MNAIPSAHGLMLAIDTSVGPCSVALRMGGQTIAQLLEDAPGQQSRLLVPLVERLLAQAGCAYADLTSVAVAVGPGSFTSIRTGMAVAKGIALALDIPVLGVTSLEALALRIRQASAENLPILAALNAHRGQFYLQRFAPDLRPLGQAALVEAEEAPAFLEEGEMLAGGNADLLLEALPGMKGRLRFVPGMVVADAASIAEIAEGRLERKETIEDPQPFYIRLPDAKIAARPYK